MLDLLKVECECNKEEIDDDDDACVEDAVPVAPFEGLHRFDHHFQPRRFPAAESPLSVPPLYGYDSEG